MNITMFIIYIIYFLEIRPPPVSTLFPYTTLFRSRPRTAASPSRRSWGRNEHERHHPPQRGRPGRCARRRRDHRSEEHTSELQSRGQLVCRLLLEKIKS